MECELKAFWTCWPKNRNATTMVCLNVFSVGILLNYIPNFRLTDGTRVLCTAIEIPANHVVSAVDPDTWYKVSSVGKRKAFTRFGPMWRVS